MTSRPSRSACMRERVRPKTEGLQRTRIDRDQGAGAGFSQALRERGGQVLGPRGFGDG